MIITVNGTSTDVGKTIATAALATWFTNEGKSVAVFKPAQTGVKDYVGDVQTIATLCNLPITTVEGFRLQEPLAPLQAAELEGYDLPPISTHVDTILSLAISHDVVLVEGSGGLLVELDFNRSTMIDIIKGVEHTQRVHNVLVAHPGLGTLNHVALSARCMASEGLAFNGVIVGSEPAEDDLAGRLNLTDIPRFAQAPIIGMLPADIGCLTCVQFLHTISRNLFANTDSYQLFTF